MTGRRPKTASGESASSLIPTIAVVIPLFNKAAWIEETLRSVLAQRVQPHEILIVDDGSSDGGDAIAETIGGAAVRLIRTPSPRSGPSVARNLGIREAHSDWIALLDADDLWSRDYLAQIQSAMLANPDIGCIFASRKLGQKDGAEHPPAGTGDEARKLDLDSYLDLWLATGRNGLSPMHSSTSVIRKRVLEAAGLFPEGCNRGEDKDTWLRVMGTTNAIFIPTPLARYRDDIPGQLNRTATPFDAPPLLATAIALSERAAAGSPTRAKLRKLASREAWLYSRRRRLRPLDATVLTAADFKESPFYHSAVRLLYCAGRISAFFGTGSTKTNEYRSMRQA